MTTTQLQQHWPEWEIVRPLGEGAFGKVYEIKRGEGDMEEHAALKVICIPQSESEVKYLISEGADEASVSAHFKELAGQLTNEINTQAKLKGNSNIVSYEDRKIIPDADGVGYTILIRMELLTSLLDHMTAWPMSHDDVLQLGIDMARALLLCEKHHIIHRDIKPQNIFISPNGDYKLGDFGVARELEKTTNNMSRKGTYNYMAPEVFHGQPGNATVDIYSLGIVLYTLLNGNRAPFLAPPPAPLPNAREREAAQHKRLSDEPLPPLPGVPAVLNELILRMCAFEPKERYQNARELAEAMEGVAYELRADKTVSLFSWIGSNTPEVTPPSDELTNEGSRWIDGTPVEKASTPAPAAEPNVEDKPAPSEQTPEAPQKRTALWIQILIAVLIVGAIITFAALASQGGRPSPPPDSPAEKPSASTTTTTIATTTTEKPTIPAPTTTEPTTTQTQKPEWVKAYENVLKKYVDEPLANKPMFLLCDLDRDGVPEILFKPYGMYFWLNYSKNFLDWEDYNSRANFTDGLGFGFDYLGDKLFINNAKTKIGLYYEAYTFTEQYEAKIYNEYAIINGRLQETKSFFRSVDAENGEVVRVYYKHIENGNERLLSESEYQNYVNTFVQEYHEIQFHTYSPGEDITKYWVK